MPEALLCIPTEVDLTRDRHLIIHAHVHVHVPRPHSPYISESARRQYAEPDAVFSWPITVEVGPEAVFLYLDACEVAYFAEPRSKLHSQIAR